MNFFDNPNWFLTKCLLSLFGAWPFQSPKFRNVLRSIVAFLIFSILIPEILEVFTVWGNMNMLVECATTLLLHLLTVVKMINCFANFEMEKELLTQIERDRTRNLSVAENELVQAYEDRSRSITHSYIYYIYATTITYMATPMVPKVLDYIFPLNESRPTTLLYQAEYLVDPQEYRNLILFHSYLITLFPATIVVAFDSLYANFTHHACCMFLIVSKRMQILKYNVVSRNEWNNSFDDPFRNCITQHKKTLKFAALLQKTYTKALFFVLGINMLAISITGFQTVMKLNEPSDFIRFGTYTVGQLIHLYFLSWPGQKLMDHSEDIHTAIYLGDWYNLPLHNQKWSIFVMMMGSKSCTLKAGKIYVMSLKSFSLVLKTSVSYFTLLTSLQ